MGFTARGRSMEEFIKGDVVVVPFPFSNLTSYKRRPALVVINLPGPDIVLCQITSQNREGDLFSIELKIEDWQNGGLKKLSYIRPDRIFTAEKSIILYRAGTILPVKLAEVRESFISMFDKSL